MNILYFAPIAYHGLKQRPQYLAEELAKEHNVTYVDPTVSKMKYLLKGGERPLGYHFEVSERLKVIRLDGRWSVHRSMEGLWRGWGGPERRQLQPFLRAADAVWVGYAPWYNLIRNFPGIVIYDKMDEDTLITQNKLMRRLIQRDEPALIARADHIFVTAQKFQRRIAGFGKTAVLVPNAVDREQGLRREKPVRTGEGGTRVFGYVGMISHWFDMDAVLTILTADPSSQVVLVGPVEIPQIEHERLCYTGCVPKEQVGQWIASFDVCLYPFQRTALLDTIDPVKIYEYLAANKPVLAARSVETEKFMPLVNNYGSMEELKEILTCRDFKLPFQHEEDRRKFILENDWQNRGRTIMKEL